MQPLPGRVVEGGAVLYDSDRGSSWCLVLVRAPGYSGRMRASLTGPQGSRIELEPIEIDRKGEGTGLLVTSGDISRFWVVRLEDASGNLLASGSAMEE